MRKVSTVNIENDDYFNDVINACCDTLKRNKNKIHELLKDKTHNVKITFNFYPGEVVNMDINWNKIVYDDEKHSVLGIF